MAYAVQQDEEMPGFARGDLLDGFRRTRVYLEASPRERAELESFLGELDVGDLFSPPLARSTVGDEVC